MKNLAKFQNSPTLATKLQDFNVLDFVRFLAVMALACCALLTFATPIYATNGYRVDVTPVNDPTTGNSKVRIDGYRSFNVHVTHTPSGNNAGNVTVYFYANLGSVNTTSDNTDNSGRTAFSLWGGWGAGAVTVRAKAVVNGKSYSDTATVSVVKPTGEVTGFLGFNAPNGQWHARLTPSASDVNFSGLQVTERAGGVQPGQGDYCWYLGNPQKYGPFESVTTPGATWTVGTGNWWDSGGHVDQVGYGGTLVAYWRSLGRAPCRTSFTQHMDVAVPGGGNANDVYYATNELSAGIQATTVSSGRGGQSDSIAYP